MTDQTKRKTLKTLAIGGAAVTAGTFGSLSMAAQALAPKYDMTTELAELSVNITHSWAMNDLKIEIKNETNKPITITNITPGRIETHMGELDFDQFMEEGAITLAPHGQASIGMDTRGAKKGVGLESGQFAKALQRTIRDNLSIVTDNEAFAAVTMHFDPRIV